MESPLANATPSSDIGVLFTSNLELEEDANLIENKLKSNGIINIEHCKDLEVQDLTSIGISFSDASVVIQQAKKVLFQSEKSQMQFKDVTTWLKANVLERFEPHFVNIPMKMIPFIRRSDLLAYLGIPVSNNENILNKMWEAVQQLKRVFPPPFQPMDEYCELICTTKRLPITVDLNETNFLNMLSKANERQGTVKVSFVGDTGTGKSLIISQLLNFDDRIRNAKGPLLAAPEQLEATTNNVCAYTATGRDGKANFTLLDFEGTYTGTPRILKEMWKKTWDLISNQSVNQLALMDKQRVELIRTVFPQLAYLISNIVVFVDKQPLDEGYLEKLTRFIEVSVQNPVVGEKPFLIAIQNFVDPEKGEHTRYVLEQSTADFTEFIQRQKKLQMLLQHFREICFVKLPSWSKNPLLFDQQICLLQGRLSTYAEVLKKESCFLRYFGDDRLWLKYLKVLCDEFKQSPRDIKTPKLVMSFVRERNPSPLYQRIMKFWRLIWTPPTVGNESNRQLLENNWMTCCKMTLARFASLLIEELKNQFRIILTREEDLNNKSIKEAIVNILSLLHDEIYRFSPCLALLPNEKLCGIVKEWHTTGHYGCRTGKHEGPPLPFGIFSHVVLHIKKLLKLEPLQIIEKNLKLLRKGLQMKSTEERKTLLAKWLPYCFVCLGPFAKNRPVKLLKCGHVVCQECLKQTPFFCPIHEEVVKDVDCQKRLPGYARPRILSLDGGSVRGIVLIRILDSIEKMTGYKIHELFDLVVGSGIGGIVALTLSLKRQAANDYAEFFLEYPQKIFKNDLPMRIGNWERYKYETKFLVATIRELFGDALSGLPLRSYCKPDYPMVAVTAYRKSSPLWEPVVFANYVHERGLEDCKDCAGRRLVHHCPLWQAAAMCGATPPLFRPQSIDEDEYIDGSFVANNPSYCALQEAKYIWKQTADYLISIGTGYCSMTPKSSETKLSWMNRVVDLIKETTETEEKVAKNYESDTIYYARLNPELKSTINLDTVSRNELQTLLSGTNQFLKSNNAKLKSIGQRLVASLLYVCEIWQGNNEKSAEIVIHSRHLPFRVASSLGGPLWNLSCTVVKGNFTTKIDYTGSETKNPMAKICADCIENGDILEITLGIGEGKYLISGGRITFALPYSSKARVLPPSSPPLSPRHERFQHSPPDRNTLETTVAVNNQPSIDFIVEETVIKSPLLMQWQAVHNPARSPSSTQRQESSPQKIIFTRSKETVQSGGSNVQPKSDNEKSKPTNFKKSYSAHMKINVSLQTKAVEGRPKKKLPCPPLPAKRRTSSVSLNPTAISYSLPTHPPRNAKSNENSQQPKSSNISKTDESSLANVSPWPDLKIESIIDCGAFGIVYQGIYQGIPVAVNKFLSKTTIPIHEANQKYSKEIEVLVKMNHPNIVKCFGGWLALPYFCFVTEYDECSLYDLLHKKKTKMSTQQQLEYALGIAEGMEYLHSQKPAIIHGDLKSENILIHKGVPKIANFGLSHLKQIVRSSLTQAEEHKWRAPELLQKKNTSGEQNYTEKVDVWSFGMILYELATNTIPYSHCLNQTEIYDDVVVRQKIPQSPDGIEIHIVLQELMKQCWNWVPEQRPSFTQIVQTLKNAMK
jgi:predicted acylesterase/phospholipase RssA